jgi:hypothetical protein
MVLKERGEIKSPELREWVDEAKFRAGAIQEVEAPAQD